MTEPPEHPILSMAAPFALHAVPDDERAEIERQVAAVPAAVAEAFNEEVRSVRETMAVVSAATAAEPPAHLRRAVLSSVALGRSHQSRWRTAVLAAAAAIVVGLAAFGVGIALRPTAKPPIAAQVLSAPDVRTQTTPIPTGGTATVVFSRDRNAGVLVMNNVAPPPPGTVYQMWLLKGGKPTSAGTMDAKAVSPSTTAVVTDLSASSALAFTIEPGKGSSQPTGQIFAKLPLS